MPVHSRNKGQRGERELFSILSDRLGTVVKRNVNARKGDCDGLDIPGWAVEVKRTETFLEAYWQQAVDQAEKVGRRPVLFWRKSRQPWVCMLDAADLGPYPKGYRVQGGIDFFCLLAREFV